MKHSRLWRMNAAIILSVLEHYQGSRAKTCTWLGINKRTLHNWLRDIRELGLGEVDYPTAEDIRAAEELEALRAERPPQSVPGTFVKSAAQD
jgi:transposase-like protein